MKPLAPILLASLMLAGPALAQHQGHDRPRTRPPARRRPPRRRRPVRRRGPPHRQGTGKLTLRHGEIKNLDMPAMTMVFQVSEPVLLDKLKVGDKVKFRAEKVGSGYVVTAIEAAK
jgi:Cu(I)/Ag(I) efflux system protein CusF